MRTAILLSVILFLVGCAPSIVQVGKSYKPAGKIQAQKVNDKPISFAVSGIPDWLMGGKGIKAQKDTIMCSAWPLQMNVQPGLSMTVKAMLSEVFSTIVEKSASELHFNFQILEAEAIISGGGNEALVGYKASLVGIAKIVIKLQITDKENNIVFKKIVEGEANGPLSGQSCPPMYNQMGDVMKKSIEEALSTLATSFFNSQKFQSI
jgi:hypothetical protein